MRTNLANLLGFDYKLLNCLSVELKSVEQVFVRALCSVELGSSVDILVETDVNAALTDAAFVVVVVVDDSVVAAVEYLDYVARDAGYTDVVDYALDVVGSFD
jgi:hypothetical protein